MTGISTSAEQAAVLLNSFSVRAHLDIAIWNICIMKMGRSTHGGIDGGKNKQKEVWDWRRILNKADRRMIRVKLEEYSHPPQWLDSEDMSNDNVLDINETVQGLGSRKCSELLGIHTLPVCDTVSYPSEKEIGQHSISYWGNMHLLLIPLQTEELYNEWRTCSLLLWPQEASTIKEITTDRCQPANTVMYTRDTNYCDFIFWDIGKSSSTQLSFYSYH